MRLIDFLKKEHIKVFLIGKNKKEIIYELSDILLINKTDIQKSEVRDAIFEREKLSSTGIGDNIAIPHARVSTFDDLIVACGLTEDPVNFDSLDGKPVKIVFLILCPMDKPTLQIRFLARVSRLLNNKIFREKLLKCNSTDNIYQTIADYENKHFH